MRLDSNYLGASKIFPDRDVVAGEIGTWELTYTVGKYGIDDRASIIFAWRNQSDWQLPQFDDPKGDGYSTVITDGDAKVKAERSTWRRPYINSILVKVSEGFLKEGDKIKVVLGDTSQGSIGIRAQSFRESEHEIKTLVDPFGTKRYEEIPNPIFIKVVPSVAHEIQAVVPSLINKGEEFDIVVRAIDQNGNPTHAYTGEVEVSLMDDKANVELISTLSFTSEDKGVIRFKENKIDCTGNYYVIIKDKKSGLEAISNAFIVRANNDYKLWWADMHGQTKHTIGTGSLDEYFSFARDASAIDVTAWQGNDFQITHEIWKEVREKTQEYYEPNKFCTFLGYEWSGTTPNGGDHNIYFLDDNEDFYPCSNWLEGKGECDPELNAYNMTEFYKLCEGRKDVMTIPHIGGRRGNLDYHKPEFGSLIEIHSHHGTSEWFIHDAMEKRLRVGFVGASDDHTCRQGMSYPLIPKNERASTFDVISGFTGIYSKELTRESIWEALMSRRCYATTFTRMVMDVKIGEHFMGEEIECGEIPEININVMSNSPIENVKVYNWNDIIEENTLLKKNEKKIRVSWKGVRARNRKRAAKWDGKLHVKDGKFISAKEYAFDRADQGITLFKDNTIEWISSTSGDVDGIVVEIDSKKDSKLLFASQLYSFEIDVKDISDKPTIFDAGGENLQVEVVFANEEENDVEKHIESCKASLIVKDINIKDGLNAYWVRALQADGHIAWSSPIYVNYRKK